MKKWCLAAAITALFVGFKQTCYAAATATLLVATQKRNREAATATVSNWLVDNEHRVKTSIGAKPCPLL